MIQPEQITAVILAGGRSSRMSGNDKGLIQFKQKTLIEHVIDTVKTEVKTILISANRNHSTYQKFTKNSIIQDELPNFQGPLAGIASAIKVTKTPYLLVLPCDCPLIGVELFLGLKTAMMKNNTDIITVHDGKRLQPIFALLKIQVLDSLLGYLQQDGRKISDWQQKHSLAISDFSQHQHFFTNINSPADLIALG